MRARPIALAFAVIAVAFFFAPLGLRVVGFRPDEFENRPLATKPRLSQGWNVFSQATRYLNDHVPLRHSAVRANTFIYTDVLGTTPRNGREGAGSGGLPFGAPRDAGTRKPKQEAAQAITTVPGSDGWTYVGGDFQWPCDHKTSVADAIDRWRELLDTVRAAGKRAVLFVPPDKGSVYPAHYPDNADKRCGSRGKRDFQRQLDALPPSAGIVDLAPPLRTAARKSKYLLYSRTDTHWGTPGALVMVRDVLRRFGGRTQLRASDLTPVEKVPTVGDLTKLEGRSTPEQMSSIGLRPGRPRHRIGGRVLLVGDSFRVAPAFLLAGYFRDFHSVAIDAPRVQVLDEIKAADTVILVNVERGFTGNASDTGNVSQSFVDALRNRLGN